MHQQQRWQVEETSPRANVVAAREVAAHDCQSRNLNAESVGIFHLVITRADPPKQRRAALYARIPRKLTQPSSAVIAPPVMRSDREQMKVLSIL